MGADLFIEAGAVVAERAVREGRGRGEVEEILRRAVAQAQRLAVGDAGGAP